MRRRSTPQRKPEAENVRWYDTSNIIEGGRRRRRRVAVKRDENFVDSSKISDAESDEQEEDENKATTMRVKPASIQKDAQEVSNTNHGDGDDGDESEFEFDFDDLP